MAFEPRSRANWPSWWRSVVGILQYGACPGDLYEYRTIFPEGVEIITAPVFAKDMSIETLKAMGAEAIEMSKRLVLADVISYACTAGAFMKGAEYDKGLIAAIEKITGKPTTTMANAVVESLRKLGVKRIILVSPYPEDFTDPEVRYFAEHGLEIVYHESLGITDPMVIFNRTPIENYRFTLQVYKNAPDADVIFISCGAMQAIEVIDILEKTTRMPVVSSNICNIWHCLKLAEIHEPIHGYGSLLEMER